MVMVVASRSVGSECLAEAGSVACRRSRFKPDGLAEVRAGRHDPGMQLSRYFTLEEMTFSQTAARDGIDNTPNRTHVANLRALCTDVLDPLREAVGLPIQITSGFRAPRLNKAVGGAAGSHHLEGKAADIVCPGLPVKKLFRRVVELGLPFEQLIYEGGRQAVWVHVACVRGSAKREIMTATFPPEGGVTYTRITKAQALAF